MKSDDSNASLIRVGAILRETHHRIEAAERSRISQAEMAARLGISARAYVDWLHGRGPSSVRALFDLLTMLGDREVVEILSHWREGSRNSEKNEGGESDGA